MKRGFHGVFSCHFLPFTLYEALINSAEPSWRIFFARTLSANPPHSPCYASGLLPRSDEKICANLTDFILSAIPLILFAEGFIGMFNKGGEILDVANGITTLGLPYTDLALRYLLVGLIVNFLRGWLTDFTTAYVQRQQGVKLSKELAVLNGRYCRDILSGGTRIHQYTSYAQGAWTLHPLVQGR